jgi:lysophospholipase L1-like esterase
MLLQRIGVILALVTLGGCDLLRNPSEPAVPDTVVNYAAIGASDALGIGGSSPCLPFVACTEGTGYVQQVTRRFRGAGKEVTLTNLGIPGAVLSPETEAIGDALGLDIFDDFLEREVPFVPRDATLVTVFAGGNDVNTIGRALREGQGGANVDGYIADQVEKFGRDLRTLVTGVRSRAPNARIVALNLPNMAALPYVNGLAASDRRRVQQLAVGFSARVNALTSEGVLVLDLMCDGTFYTPASLSSDGFHPSDAGYTRLADLVHTAATTGTVTPPQASCSLMSVV